MTLIVWPVIQSSTTASSSTNGIFATTISALRQSRKETGGGDEKKIVALAIDRLAVAFGQRILAIVAVGGIAGAIATPALIHLYSNESLQVAALATVTGRLPVSRL